MTFPMPHTGGGFVQAGGGVSTRANALLGYFVPADAEFPSSAPAIFFLRGTHVVISFDQASDTSVIFEGILPRHYAGNGITVILHWCARITTGNVAWKVAFEKVDGQDIDSDSFASDQNIGAVSSPGVNGQVTTSSVNVSNGANIDSITGGDKFRLRVTRDTATDTAGDHAQLRLVELKET